MNTALFEEMKSILCEELDVPADKLQLDATLIDDLGADSLDLVHLALKVEERFQIEIAERDLISLKTVGDVLEHLSTRIQAA
jgi:acyl carrier protein